MPRLSKRKKEEYALFIASNGRRTYNQLCRKCIHFCKQSFRAKIIECPKFISKRKKRPYK